MPIAIRLARLTVPVFEAEIGALGSDKMEHQFENGKRVQHAIFC